MCTPASQGYRKISVDGFKALVIGQDEPGEAIWELKAALDGEKITLFLDDGPVRPEAYVPESVNLDSVDGKCECGHLEPTALVGIAGFF